MQRMVSRRHLSVPPPAHEVPDFLDLQSAADGLSGALQVAHVFSYSRTDGHDPTTNDWQERKSRTDGWVDNGPPCTWPYRITARSAATQTCRTSSHRPTSVAPGRYV